MCWLEYEDSLDHPLTGLAKSYHNEIQKKAGRGIAHCTLHIMAYLKPGMDEMDRNADEWQLEHHFV